jgi:hypothetical protein
MSACGPQLPDASRPSYLTYGSELTLAESATKPEISVCVLHGEERDGRPLSDESRALLEERRELIQASVLRWIDALRPIASVPLATRVGIKGSRDGCRLATPTLGDSGSLNAGLADATLVFDPMTLTSHASLLPAPAHPVVILGSRGGERQPELVLLHELGHAFGLRDAYRYTPEGASRPQFGQPLSVMSTAAFAELQPDDVHGVQYEYCRRMRGQANAGLCAAVPPPGIVANAVARFAFTGVSLRDGQTPWGPGVTVAALDEAGPLHARGLRRQDVIRSLGDQAVASASAIDAVLLYAQTDLIDAVVRRYDDPSHTSFHDERLYLLLTALPLEADGRHAL